MSTKAPQAKRLLFVDALRGLAVLSMIQLHTSHGWLQPDARAGPTWDAAQFFGGLAAPLFLLLSGAGLGLQWSRPRMSAADTVHKTLARGFELVVLGYGLRLQMWIIDGAAYARPETYPALILLASGYALAYRATVVTTTAPATRCAERSRRSVGAALGLGLAIAGIRWAYAVDPLRADGLVRVDILQCIGASLVVLSLLGACSALRRSSVFLAFAAVVALGTPLQQTWVPGPLPRMLASYLAQWPSPPEQRVLAMFPLFPWLSFAASGVAVGLAWGRARDAHGLELTLTRMIAAGAGLALIIHCDWAPLFGLDLPAALLSLMRVGFKTALCLVMIGPALAFTHAPQPISAPLQQLGRASLLVYWVHLEFAFGTLSRPVARALGPVGWMCGTATLVLVMWAMATLRNNRDSPAKPHIRRPVVTG